MKKPSFDSLIHAAQARPLPTCPGNLEDNVLRRVRLARDEAYGGNALDWLLGQLPGRRVALGGLALVLFLSVSASMIVATRTASAADRQHLAANSLDFGVFERTPILNFD